MAASRAPGALGPAGGTRGRIGIGHTKEGCMRSKRNTLVLLGVMLLGILASAAQASTARVVMIEDFDAIG